MGWQHYPSSFTQHPLTHWGRVTHIYISKLTIIGTDNGLSPAWLLAIIWTKAGILLIQNIGKIVSEILSEIHTFSFKKMHLKMSSVKWRQFCISLNVLKRWGWGCWMLCVHSLVHFCFWKSLLRLLLCLRWCLRISHLVSVHWLYAVGVPGLRKNGILRSIECIMEANCWHHTTGELVYKPPTNHCRETGVDFCGLWGYIDISLA